MSKTRNIRSSEEHSSLSSCTSSSLSSDDEEIDTRDLKPIKNYLANRKELARQLFKSVKPEKIRMMLPQVLKHVDLNELEEYCVNELNGMSKARILSKLSGKPMLESSDTNESDDSGPSLEIISDTEEWLTDDDTSKKENGRQGKLIKRDKVKIKRKAHIKKNDPDKTNSKAKCSIKNENSDKTNKNVKIKKEDDKGKEGDSLLDLLELEMRARAIRALIRKEEDIIPSTNPSETSDSQTIENNIGMPQDDDKAKETCRKQLEKIISAQQSTKGEEEDVVLVIQPTPVVELLSSDSDREAHGETRVNQKLKNKRAIGKSASNSDENAKNSSKTLGTQVTGTHTYTNTNIVSKTDLSSETRTIMPDRNVDIKNNTLSISISANNVAERRKKSKKKSHAKSQLTSTSENTSNSKQINTPEIIEQSNDVEDDNTTEQLSLSDENKVIEEKSNTEEEISKETRIEEERLADLDEVIDLDDYCDVMDIENCDEDSQDEVIVPFPEEHKQSAPEAILPKSDSMETWTSRYYQTDDVQNVIKESKIQSEIRKRLRERQRLSKLSKSPNLNSSSQSSTDTAATSEKIPTGSVEEYLALKRAMNANVSTNSNNNTTQDNSETINSDVNVKEMSVQDESISSQQEYTDNDAQKAITSEITESTKLAEADTKHDTQLD